MSDQLRSSPHERMLAYLRGGDDLIPPGLDSATDWEGLHEQLCLLSDVSESNSPFGGGMNETDHGTGHEAGLHSGTPVW